MKYALLILSVVVVATALPAKEVESYHHEVGIKLAERVKQAEQGANSDGARIVGGLTAGLGNNPFMAGLVITLTTGQLSLCGGSLLSNTRVLTAAHCWFDGRFQGEELTVVLGSLNVFSGGVRVQTRDVVLHPNYNVNNYNHDIAIIRMGWVRFTDVIQPVKLPFGDLLEDRFVGRWAMSVGYGTDNSSAIVTTNQILIDGYLRVISNSACQLYFPAHITDSHICTSGVGPAGPCAGDDGSPLTLCVGERVLIGVMSFRSAQGCESEWPAAYTRVASYVPWIEAHL